MLNILADNGFNEIETSRYEFFNGGDLSERGFVQLDAQHCAEIVVYERDGQRLLTAHILRTEEVIITMTDSDTLVGATCTVVEIDDFGRFMRFVAEYLIATTDLTV